MKKRLRKKRRLGEFTDYGFIIEAKWSKEISFYPNDEEIARINTTWNDFIEFVESRNLVSCGGSNGKTFGCMIYKDPLCRNTKSGKAAVNPTQADKDAMITYMLSCSEFTDVKVGRWLDINKDDETQPDCGYRG